MDRIKQEVTVERQVPGKPHTGKVLAIIFPHSDDFSIATGGTIAKLINEGYTGYFIRTTNDEMDSFDLSVGETILGNERDTKEMARILGIKKVFDLNYRNHYLDEVPPTEIRSRLIVLFRMLKVDTVISFDPWGHYEENPDHYVTAQAVEAASWMAGGHLDEPEQIDAGLEPHSVSDRYYYSRGPQCVNRVVDIGPFVGTKLAAICANKTQVGNMVSSMKSKLAKRNLKLPILEVDGEMAIRNYSEAFLMEESRRVGCEYGIQYGEKYHYFTMPGESSHQYVQDYVKRHAIPLHNRTRPIS